MNRLQLRCTIAALATLAGCTSAPGRGELAVVGPLPSAGIVHLTGAHEAIVVTDALPEGATVLGQVKGTSCKNSLLDPAPSDEKALLQLREKAASMGATGVYGVTYASDPHALGKNCWAIRNATGTAYSAAAG